MSISDPRTQTALAKALALASLTPPVHVGPAIRAGKTKRPTTPNGFKDYSLDPATIVRLFENYGGNEVAIWAGPSRLLIEDIDVGAENGFETALRMDADWTSNLSYSTPSGGEHHVWPAPDPAPGPSAPIKGYPGIDRRSGDSLCLWYGPVPTQADWDRMHAQTAPAWLVSGSGSARSSGRGVRSADLDEVHAWISSLTDGDAIESLLEDTSHYGPTIRALVRLVEHSRQFPTWPGTRETFEALADGYVNSTVATTENRDTKVLEMVRWALGATADVEDMTWAYQRWGSGVLPVPSPLGHSEADQSLEETISSGTAGTGATEVQR